MERELAGQIELIQGHSLSNLPYWEQEAARLRKDAARAVSKVMGAFQDWHIQFYSFNEPFLDTTGPFAGFLIPLFAWLAHQESLRKGRPVELGMEKARALGHRIGRPMVTDRKGFNRRFGAILERLAAQQVSRRRAAKELGIGYATLKRLIDGQGKQDGSAN